MLRFRFAVLSVLACFMLLSTSALAINLYCLPQAAFGSGGGVQLGTQISMWNTADQDGWVIIYFYDDLGHGWTVPVSCTEDASLNTTDKAIDFTLPAKRKYAIKLGPGAAMQVGWVKIWSQRPLQVSATYGFYQARPAGELFEPVWEAAVLPAPSALHHSFPAHSKQSDSVAGVSVNTAYSVANPTELTATVTAKIYNSADELLDTREFTVPALGHRAQFINELFAGATLTSFRGTVCLESNHPIAGFAMTEAKGERSTVYSTLPLEPESRFQVNTSYDLDYNKVEDAMSVVPPSEIYGTVSTGVDYYSVSLNGGQTLEVIALTQALGSPLHPSVYIQTADGSTELATGQELFPGSLDHKATYTATTSGPHVIKVTGVSPTYGPHAFYRMFVRVHD